MNFNVIWKFRCYIIIYIGHSWRIFTMIYTFSIVKYYTFLLHLLVAIYRIQTNHFWRSAYIKKHQHRFNYQLPFAIRQQNCTFLFAMRTETRQNHIWNPALSFFICLYYINLQNSKFVKQVANYEKSYTITQFHAMRYIAMMEQNILLQVDKNLCWI